MHFAYIYFEHFWVILSFSFLSLFFDVIFESIVLVLLLLDDGLQPLKHIGDAYDK